MASRPTGLDGKTVCLVDVRFNDGDLLLQQIEAWFAAHMPGVKTLFFRKSGLYNPNARMPISSMSRRIP